jgi:glycosidase
MPTWMKPHLEQAPAPASLAAAQPVFATARANRDRYTRSPVNWADELLYFLLPDRFSDTTARPTLTRKMLSDARRGAAARPAGWRWDAWAASGLRWQGGTIAGIQRRLPYLQALGVTTVWVGPVLKQRVKRDTYHGYAIQDFLEVDLRFGTRAELAALVDAAHAMDPPMRVILDVIVQHTGDNWGYVRPGDPAKNAASEATPYQPWPRYYGSPAEPDLAGWRTAWRDTAEVGLPFGGGLATRDQGVWPTELQSFDLYTRAGTGSLADSTDPNDPNWFGAPNAEHKRSDFFDLKDVALDTPAALEAMIRCHQYWIALLDVDGFRIDTVKHMSVEEARAFCGAIREYAESLGKRNFFLVAEVPGSVEQEYYLDQLATGARNLSAALDIGTARGRLRAVAMGSAASRDYLEVYTDGFDGLGSHRRLGNELVTPGDDHDMIGLPQLRFSDSIADDSKVKDWAICAQTAIQLFAIGIPCIYYGDEQALSLPEQSVWQFLWGQGLTDGNNSGDRYLREAMFGPDHPRAAFETEDLAAQVAGIDSTRPGFAAFGLPGVECFDTASPAFLRIAAMTRVRAQVDALRVGRQYAREIRPPGAGAFGFPAAGQLAAWSRILSDQEALCVVNPSGGVPAAAEVVIAKELSAIGDEYRVVLNTAQTAAGAGYDGPNKVGSTVAVAAGDADRLCVSVGPVGPAEALVLVKA